MCWGALPSALGGACCGIPWPMPAGSCWLSGCSHLVLSLLPGGERKGPKGDTHVPSGSCGDRRRDPPGPCHHCPSRTCRLPRCWPGAVEGPASQLPLASASSPVTGGWCRVACPRPLPAPGLRSRHPASGRALTRPAGKSVFTRAVTTSCPLCGHLSVLGLWLQTEGSAALGPRGRWCWQHMQTHCPH